MPRNERLSQHRIERNWRQRDVAEKLEVTLLTVQRWERGYQQPSAYYRVKLSKLFGLSPEALGLLEAPSLSAPPEREAKHTARPDATLPDEKAQERFSRPQRERPWNVPFAHNPFFTGRSQLLEHLHQTLAAGQAVALSQALIGLAGIGKTATAIEYAYRYTHEYEAVLWVRADTETLVSDFAHLAAILELPEQQEHDQTLVVEAVKRWLQKHDSWLLIFDNADNPALITDFLPGQGRGAVLLTTRSQATGPHITKIVMGQMSREEGIDFLLNRVHADEEQRPTPDGVDPQEQEEAGQLWESMDGLPLALDQAAAYMEETGCTLSDYLDAFKTHRKDLLERRGRTASEHRASVAATWLMALEKVEQVRTVGPAATQLLHFCAFLHPDAIPESMIIKGAIALGPNLQRTATNTSAWNEAIGELLKYSLVKRDGKKKILTLHRLVQAVIQDSMTQKAVREWAERTVRAVDAAFPDQEPGSWSQCELLMPHALLAAHYIEEYHFIWEEAGNLLYKMASYLHDRARYAEAEPLYQKALRLQEQRSGKEHLGVAGSLNGLANLYRDWGKFAQAEPCYQRALRIREHQLGQEHLDVAISLEGLAILYREQGKYTESEKLHLRALTIREQQLGSEHLQVASSLNGLALLYKEQGRYGEAERFYQQALHIREHLLGPVHPQVASSLNNLGIIYMMQGNYAEAERLHQRSLALSLQVYGEDHPDIATRLNNLAVLCHEQGKYTEAALNFERAWHLWEKHLGETHPHVAKAINNLAETYTTLGKYAEAEPLYQRALHIWAQQLDPDHPDGADPLDGLANLYREQGRYVEAEPLYQRALAIREKALGREHPETALIMYHLALLWEAQDNQEEASTWCTHALAIREQTLGTHHPKTTQTRSRLIDLLHALKQHEEAARLEAIQAAP